MYISRDIVKKKEKLETHSNNVKSWESCGGIGMDTSVGRRMGRKGGRKGRRLITIIKDSWSPTVS